MATSLNKLAGLYRAQGKYADAEPLYRRALPIWEKARGRDHPDVAINPDGLAEVYRKQGNYSGPRRNLWVVSSSGDVPCGSCRTCGIPAGSTQALWKSLRDSHSCQHLVMDHGL